MHFLNRLRGLRRNAEARMLPELKHIRFRKHDIEIRQILGQTAHLDVIAFSDDDRVIALLDQPGNCAMGHVY